MGLADHLVQIPGAEPDGQRSRLVHLSGVRPPVPASHRTAIIRIAASRIAAHCIHGPDVDTAAIAAARAAPQASVAAPPPPLPPPPLTGHSPDP